MQCCYDHQCGPCEQCHNGWCESVCDSGEQCCTLYEPLSPADLLNGGYCAHCCGSEECGDCEECYEGHCEYQCEKGEICCQGLYCAYEGDGCCGVQGDWCELLSAADHLNGGCCYGSGLRCCYDYESGSGVCALCCDSSDCGEYEPHCCGGVCSECCYDHDCATGRCHDGYCVECRWDNECGKGEICCDGECTAQECCGWSRDDPDHCGECETCIEGWCKPTGVELYGACNPMYVGVADDSSPQLNCCNGLVCCDTTKHGLVCLECCADADCADGCYCDDGFCSCPCWSDGDCGDGTCCCKNGSCSADCCYVPPKKPHHPHYGGQVTTLPATGSGDSRDDNGWFGAAALGAAAAYLVSRKLKLDETPETPAPEE